MTPDTGLTFADWLGIAGFGLAVIGLFWQAGTWFWQYRIRLKMAIFTLASATGTSVVVEAVNLNRVHAVQIRDVRIKWQGGGMILPASTWTQPSRIEPLGIFQAQVLLHIMQAQAKPPPTTSRAWVKTASGKEFSSKATRLE